MHVCWTVINITKLLSIVFTDIQCQLIPEKMNILCTLKDLYFLYRIHFLQENPEFSDAQKRKTFSVHRSLPSFTEHSVHRPLFFGVSGNGSNANKTLVRQKSGHHLSTGFFSRVKCRNIFFGAREVKSSCVGISIAAIFWREQKEREKTNVWSVILNFPSV